MTLAFELNLDSFKMNQPAKYQAQASFCSKVICQDTQAHKGPIAVPGLLMVGKY